MDGVKADTRNGWQVSKKLVHLCLATHVPTKWVAVDLETGHVWNANQDGCWVTPDLPTAEETLAKVARACLEARAKSAGPLPPP